MRPRSRLVLRQTGVCMDAFAPFCDWSTLGLHLNGENTRLAGKLWWCCGSSDSVVHACDASAMLLHHNQVNSIDRVPGAGLMCRRTGLENGRPSNLLVQHGMGSSLIDEPRPVKRARARE